MDWLNGLWMVSRFVHFVSLFLLLSSCFFLLRLLPDPLLTVLTPSWRHLQKQLLWVLALSSISLVYCQLAMIGLAGSILLQPAMIGLLLLTEIGRLLAWQVTVPLLALLVTGWLVSNPYRLLFFALSVLLPLAALGHANSLSGLLGGLQRGNQAIHLVAVAYWSGGLCLVSSCLPYLRQPTLRPAAIELLRRFSYYGHLAVAATLLSGVVSLLLISGFPYPLNHYGLLLTAKILLVAIMVAIALWNRYQLVARIQQTHDRQAEQRLIKNTGLATLLSLMVVGLVAVFATLSPS